MGGWYWIAVCAGLGAAAGVLLADVAGRAVLAALPALAARLRRRAPERYAGLRTLARD